MATYDLYPTDNYIWSGTHATWETLRKQGSTSAGWTSGVKAAYECTYLHALSESFLWFATDTIPNYLSLDSATLGLWASSIVHAEDGNLLVVWGGNGQTVTQRFVGSGGISVLNTAGSKAITDLVDSRVNVTMTMSYLGQRFFSNTQTTTLALVPEHIEHTLSGVSYLQGATCYDRLAVEAKRPLLSIVCGGGLSELTVLMGMEPYMTAGAGMQRASLGLKPSLKMRVTRLTTIAASEDLALYDKDGYMVTSLPAAIRMTRKLDGPATLDFTVPRQYIRDDGVREDRTDVVTTGMYASYRGVVFLITDVTTDRDSHVQVQAQSREIELHRYLSNYSVDLPFSYLSKTPTTLMNLLLNGGDYDTAWTYEGSMDARDAAVLFTDPGFWQSGGWARSTTAIWSAAAGDVLSYAFTGSYVTIAFAAGGGSSTMQVTVDDEVHVLSLDVSAAGSYIVSGLSTDVEHLLELEVLTGTVAITGLTLEPVRRLSVRWNYKPITECLDELLKTAGGEIAFDTANKVMYHDSRQGVDQSAANLLEFVQGYNVLQMEIKEQRTDVVNRLHYLGYGEGATQLSLIMESTSTVDGLTSSQTYGLRQGVYVNKDVSDLASAQAEAAMLIEDLAWPKVSYTTTVPSEDGVLLDPGDTVRFAYGEEAVLARIATVAGSMTVVGLPVGYLAQVNQKPVSRGTAGDTGVATIDTVGMTFPATSLEILNPDLEVVARLTSTDYADMAATDTFEFAYQYVEELLRVLEVSYDSQGSPAQLTVGDRVGTLATALGDPIRSVSRLLTAF